MKEILNRDNNKIVVIETTMSKKLKVYGLCSNLLSIEHLALIGRIVYNSTLREWVFIKSINVFIRFRSMRLNEIDKYLEALNKK